MFVVNRIEVDIKRKTTVLREPLSVQKRVAITLYYLSSSAEYRTIANLFGVSRSFVCKMCKRGLQSIGQPSSVKVCFSSKRT